MEERGQYITLLCNQHQLGHLPENHMVSVCLNINSPVVAKFKRDENGFFYNERLEVESNRRSDYVNSRHINGKHGGRPKKKENHMVLHMGNHMDNDNEDENEDENSSLQCSSLKDGCGEKPQVLSDLVQGTNHQYRHSDFLHAGPIEWINHDYASGRAWLQLYRDRPDVNPFDVIESAREYRQYCDRCDVKGRYVKKPDNWLRDGGWSTDWAKLSDASRAKTYRERKAETEYDEGNYWERVPVIRAHDKLKGSK
jgi:hypothetical protein